MKYEANPRRAARFGDSHSYCLHYRNNGFGSGGDTDHLCCGRFVSLGHVRERSELRRSLARACYSVDCTSHASRDPSSSSSSRRNQRRCVLMRVATWIASEAGEDSFLRSGRCSNHARYPERLFKPQNVGTTRHFDILREPERSDLFTTGQQDRSASIVRNETSISPMRSG